jgi:hypothetical protein
MPVFFHSEGKRNETVDVVDLQSTAKREHPYCKNNSIPYSTCDLQSKIG